MDKNEQWEENQKKKEYLNGYRNAKKREKRILEQIQRLRLDEMCPAVQYDDMPHGSNASDLSDYAVKMDELMEELEQERLEAVKQYSKIYREIKSVKDEREQEILTYRYILGESWEVICGIMGLSWRRVHQLHASSLKDFPNCIELHTQSVI